MWSWAVPKRTLYLTKRSLSPSAAERFLRNASFQSPVGISREGYMAPAGCAVPLSSVRLLVTTPSVPKYKALESSNSRNNSERKWLQYPSFYTTNQLSTYSPTSFNFVLSFQDLIFWHKISTLQDTIFWDGGSIKVKVKITYSLYLRT
jgi:hypothetical protein